MPTILLISFALGMIAPEIFREEIRRGPVITSTLLMAVGVVILLVQFYRQGE